MRVRASSGRCAHRFEISPDEFAQFRSSVAESAKDPVGDMARAMFGDDPDLAAAYAAMRRVDTKSVLNTFASREKGGFSRAECVRFHSVFLLHRRAFLNSIRERLHRDALKELYDDFVVAFKIAGRRGGSLLYC